MTSPTQTTATSPSSRSHDHKRVSIFVLPSIILNPPPSPKSFTHQVISSLVKSVMVFPILEIKIQHMLVNLIRHSITYTCIRTYQGPYVYAIYICQCFEEEKKVYQAWGLLHWALACLGLSGCRAALSYALPCTLCPLDGVSLLSSSKLFLAYLSLVVRIS